MATGKEEKENVRELCDSRREDCKALLNHLEDLLAANEKQKAGWSDAGNLNHLRDLLVNAVRFYGGLDTEEVEDVLAEIRG